MRDKYLLQAFFISGSIFYNPFWNKQRPLPSWSSLHKETKQIRNQYAVYSRFAAKTRQCTDWWRFYWSMWGTPISAGRVQLKCDGTRWLRDRDAKGKLANGVRSQYSYATSEPGVSSIITADAHTSSASSRLNWLPRRFKWTRTFSPAFLKLFSSGDHFH